jgi:opacity protein-like surface antigen
MKKTALTIALLTASAIAGAQENPFEGPSIGVSVSSVGGSTNISGNPSTSIGQQSVVPTADLGFTFAASKEIALGLTGTYDLADTNGSMDGNSNFVGKNHFSVNFKPGYVLGSNTMLYALVGYNRMQGKFNAGGVTGQSNLDGVGYGIGIQALIDKHFYVKLEGQQVNYNASTVSGITYKPSTTIATLGVGYKF